MVRFYVAKQTLKQSKYGSELLAYGLSLCLRAPSADEARHPWRMTRRDTLGETASQAVSLLACDFDALVAGRAARCRGRIERFVPRLSDAW